jgi:hypothetical protein
MTEENDTKPRNIRPAVIRIAAATGAALAFCLAVYLLLEAVQPDRGLIGFSFLLVLPAAVSAFVAYVADPWRERKLRSYLLIPLWILLAVIPFSIIFLREGTICVVILSPLWLASGMVGSGFTYWARHKINDGKKYCVALFAIPLVSMQIEPMIVLPTSQFTVEREITVNAKPKEIWPLLEGIPDVRSGEGAWNFSQDVIGVPRPVGATLVGKDIGADRMAKWTYGINFRERITRWQPGRNISWKFIFDNLDGWEFTDRHLLPASPYYRVTDGGYTMTPINDAQTRVRIHTSYWVKTPVNSYSAIWGEVFIGDLENNLLALIKNRAENKLK